MGSPLGGRASCSAAIQEDDRDDPGVTAAANIHQDASTLPVVGNRDRYPPALMDPEDVSPVRAPMALVS